MCRIPSDGPISRSAWNAIFFWNDRGELPEREFREDKGKSRGRKHEREGEGRGPEDRGRNSTIDISQFTSHSVYPA